MISDTEVLFRLHVNNNNNDQGQNLPKTKMPLPKSKVWAYFTRNVDGAQCKICEKNVVSKGGNTTNLAAHLRRTHKIETTSHPSVAGLFKKPPATASQTPSSVIDPDLPSLPTLQSDENATNDLTDLETKALAEKKPVTSDVQVLAERKPVTSIWDRARQGKLAVDKQNRITRKIASYLVKEMRPFSTVESESFREMIHAIDDRVVVPNRTAFSERIIPAWYSLEAAKLEDELNGTNYVALTSDCWTSRTTIPYMTVTAHYANEDFELKSKVLQTKVLDDKHTGENISVALNSVLQTWKIAEKANVITTDNASNMGKAIEISDINLKIGYFAHTLDLAAKKAVDLAKPVTRKMKPVISFLHRSHIGAKVFREMQETVNVARHKLINDVETRWNSTYLMFERYFEQRIAIHATFLDKRLDGSKDVYRDFQDYEVKKAEEFIETMKPFYDMTVAVCSEKNPTASLILVLLDKLSRKCQITTADSDFVKALKKAIGDNSMKGYRDENVRSCLMKSMCLDPQTKSKAVIEEGTWTGLADEIVELMEKESSVNVKVEQDEDVTVKQEPAEKKPKISLLDSFLSDDDDDDVTVTASYRRSRRDLAEDEITRYREMPVSKTPLLFWNINKNKLPHLATLASKYLVIQATSVASERVFSTSGDILSTERSSLDANALDAMIFLKKNADKTSVFTI